jgi:hypothetical protein
VKPFLVAVLIASLSLVPSPARAADNAICTASMPVTLDPGLDLTSRPSTFSTQGATGTIDCHGSVNGKQITGPGTFVNGGVNNGGTCAQGMGTGQFQVQIPTGKDGKDMETVSGPYTFQYLGVLGTFSGPKFSGTFQFLPTAGNCLATPMTKVLLLAQGIITS